ncbi:hypothetical protein Cgig2_021336 [Carnegiea gigantea]|uniref:Uncharacterized protein n=1 Tax=Carnegiea gigantea TaxID=171969 RepID=A0A9Q1GRE7_9CARY|nr:hypothetical protein Cgig2_021336 [Carnegiea gigantea]
MTPYASKGQGAEWYEEQEESSRPPYSKTGGFEERIMLPLRSGKKDNDAYRNMKIVATIIRGIDGKELSAGYRKAQIRKLSQDMAARELKPLVGPTMTFGLEDMRPSQTPHNDALVIQLKVATAMVRRILIDTKSLVDIITLECLKKLQYSEKDLKIMEAPAVGFGG